MSGAAERSWHGGGCHCGAVRFEVRAAREVTLTDCNCSMCSMTGFQHLIVPQADFRLLQGADRLTTYTFNRHQGRHMFCRTCGIEPFAMGSIAVINANCLDDVDPRALTPVHADGRAV